MEASNGDDSNEENEDENIENSQSHHLVGNQNKPEELRITKSSPHRNVQLHHTRSFSEIRHLHPSIPDLSSGLLCAKSKIIDAIQQGVRRPESVLEISDLTSVESDDGLDDDEDIYDAQEKGNETMKRFMDANISVPLDGALSSRSSSQSSFDSDIASEREMIMASWDNEVRESVSSSSSCTEKQFLTPSGQLLYREHQADSTLDTRRVKLSPSTVERPISPLAAKCGTDKISTKYSDEHDSGKEMQKKTECGCGLSNKVKDLERIINEYEIQYDKVVKKQTKQSEETKKLRKDNANLHKEQNRLQLVIKESYKQGETTQEQVSKLLSAKQANLQELNRSIKELKTELKERDEQIRSLKETIDQQASEISIYDDIFREVTQESNALLEALATELGNKAQEPVTIDIKEDKKSLVPILKKRRVSLQDDFRNFAEHIVHLPTGAQQSTLDSKIDELQTIIHNDFDEMTSECKQTLSCVERTGESVKTLQEKACGLEAMLLGDAGSQRNQEEAKRKEKQDIGQQFEELQKEHKKGKKEFAKMTKDCEKLRGDYSKIVEEKNVLESEFDEHIKKLSSEKSDVRQKLEQLEKDLRSRLEKSNHEKADLETQLESLRESYVTNKAKWKEQMTWAFDQGRTVDSQDHKMQQTDHPSCSNQEQSTQSDHHKYDKVDDCVKQLGQLTTALNTGIENANQQAELLARQVEIGEKPTTNKKGNTFFGGGMVLLELKEIYEDHIASVQQHAFNFHKTENQFLKEQLMIKERDEEINKCHMESTRKANEVYQEELQASKIKCQQLKKELRDVKDRLLVLDAKQRMSAYLNNGKTAEPSSQSTRTREYSKNVKVERHI